MEILKVYKDVVNSLENISNDSSEIIGFLKLSSENILKISELSKESLCDEYIDIYKNINDNSIISKLIEDIKEKELDASNYIRIVLQKHNLPSKNNYGIAETWSDLLRYDEHIKQPLENLFIHDTGIIYSKTHNFNNSLFQNYLNLGEVYKFLRTLSENTECEIGTIFYQRQLKIDFNVKLEDIQNRINIVNINKLLEKDLHKEAITHLVCKEVVTFLKNINQKDRFSHLLKNLDSLTANVLLSYQSYVDNYNFEKVRAEYIEKKTEYVEKINNVFDSVATKILATPVAIWFATAQINAKTTKNYTTFDFIFYKNTLVLLTVIIMFVLLILNIFTQKSTLKVMKNEYSEVFKNLKSKFSEETTNILNIETELDQNAKSVSVKIWSSIVLSILLTVCVSYLYLKATFPHYF